MNASISSALALGLKGFFIDYIPSLRALSPHTLQSYRDSLKLLLQFAAGKNGDPSQLTVEAFNVEMVTAFLENLETGRKNRVSTSTMLGFLGNPLPRIEL